MDELADMIHCKPLFTDFITKDPALAFKILQCPVYPYTYRLKGPHTWEGARRAIFDADRRIMLGFIPCGGVPQTPSENKTPQYIAYLIAVIVLFLAVWGFYH